jgi:predicted AlkP superfamily phosphohydrolase/phosphomutase
VATKLKNPPRVLILGVDGASLDLLQLWSQQGLLPHFQEFFQNGATGPLTSIIPPITAAAWTSFMTGKNPGKHGLFDFLELLDYSYQVRYTNARSRLVSTIWEMFNAAGLRVGLYNVPMTYPPDPLDGFVISGMDTPDPDGDFTHPRELKKELLRKFDKVSLDIRHLGFMRNDPMRSRVLKELKALETHRTDLFLYLLEHHPVDVAMLVFSTVDTVQHFFWHYHDPKHHWHQEVRDHTFANAIREVYIHVDSQLQRLLSAIPPETHVIIMSDHGAGATGRHILYINRFLAREGFLALNDSLGPFNRYARQAMGLVDSFVRSHLNSKQKTKLAHLFPWLRVKWESTHSGLGDIHWAKTRAFAIEILGIPPGIWINLKGRCPLGCVEPGSEYDSLVSDLRSRLLNLRVEGQPLIPQVFHRDELFAGPFLDQAPDLILNWWEGPAFITKPSFEGGLRGEVCEPVKSFHSERAEWSGTHRLQGIVLLKGQSFQRGIQIHGSHILDIAPTIFYMLGLPVPVDFDGQILTQAFTQEYLAAHPLTTKEATEEVRHRAEATYSSDEEEKIAAKLKDLGYLE